MKLYEIENQLEYLLSQLEDGEFDDEQKIVFDSLQMAELEKLESYGKWIINQEADAAKVDAEIKRLEKKRKSLKDSAERGRVHLQSYMERNSIDKVKGETLSLSTRETPGSLFVANEDVIPSEYFDYPDPKISKQRIKDALKDGAEIPGCSILKRKIVNIK